MTLELFAGLAVSDLPRAVAWYDRLLGEVETFVPHDSEHVWTLADGRHLYVELRPAVAGRGFVTLFVDDLSAFLAAASSRGLAPESQETYDNGVRKVLFRDPDGNEVGVGGAPVGG